VDSPSYRSFLVRLWRDPVAVDVWQGEVESIQSGQVMTAESLDTLLEVIRQAAGISQPPASPTSEPDHESTATEGATS
jgi:hypothetical protein